MVSRLFSFESRRLGSKTRLLHISSNFELERDALQAA